MSEVGTPSSLTSTPGSPEDDTFFSLNSNTHLPTQKVLGSQPTQPWPLSRAILLPSLLTVSRCMELIAIFWKGMSSTACSSGQCGVVVVGRRGM